MTDTRLLVCGGRDYQDAEFVGRVLDDLCRVMRVVVVIHGGATGADALAKAWAASRGIPDEPYPVTKEEWKRLGKPAGPIRNQRMLDEGKPDYAVAFPGMYGTSDMVVRLKRAKVGVMVFRTLPPSEAV